MGLTEGSGALTQSTLIDINKHNILLEIRYNIFMNELQKRHDNKIKELNDKIENLDDKIKRLELTEGSVA